MQNQYRKTVLSLILLFLTCCFIKPLEAVNPVKTTPEIFEQKTSEQTNLLSPEKLKNDLSWKEKIVLKLIEKKVKKARKKLAKVLETPSGISPRDNCYTILLKSGEEMKVYISGKTDTELLYRPCGESEADEKSLPLDEVAQIKSRYGQVIYEVPDIANYPANPKMDPIGLAGFIFSTLGFALLVKFLFTISAILLMLGAIMGIIGIIKYISNPGKYKGLFFSVVALAPVMIIALILIYFSYL